MPITVTYDFNKMANSVPKFMAQGINRVADVIRDDMIKGVKKGVDINGAALKGLKSATKKAKRRKGSPHPNRALWDTGLMVGGIYVNKRAKASSLVATIIVPKGRGLSKKGNRQKIGGYHNKGDSPQPKREFFGVAKRTEKPIDVILRRQNLNIVKAAHTGRRRIA